MEPPAHLDTPPSIMAWLESSIGASKTRNFATVKEFLHSKIGPNIRSRAANLTPRLSAINQFFDLTCGKNSSAEGQVEAMVQAGITMRMLNTFPEALLAILSEPIVQCQAEPPTSWSSTLLEYVSREDLGLRLQTKHLPSTDTVKVLPDHVLALADPAAYSKRRPARPPRHRSVDRTH
jgi:anaphase-promoting complex subunit 1